MQSLAAARRPKPKVIKPAHDENDNDNHPFTEKALQSPTPGTESMDLEPVVVPAIKRLNRPALEKKRSGSKLKLSFGGDEVRYS
jgi:hypothetical protein